MPIRNPYLKHQPVIANKSQSAKLWIQCNCGWLDEIVSNFPETVEKFNGHLPAEDYDEFHIGHVLGLCGCDA